MIDIYTNIGLVEYAKAWLDYETRYGWGCWGQPVSDSIISQKAKQYPAHYNVTRRGDLVKLVGKAWLIDCVGLIKGYYWDCKPGGKSVGYHAASDVDADTMYARATCKGPISTLPEKPGLCVQMDGHIGIYIGNGLVIESTKGPLGDGVVQTKLTDRKWLHWLQCPYIIYGEVTTVADNKPSPWAKDAMAWAVKKEICSNDKPQEPVTKEQVAFMLYKALGGK
ncbi:MAG: hypothetical protein GXY34_15010 [Syntrophomonadaceae bacterium]|nr:hypothetical protein [Syntrophomonadaceae bacterium]